VTTRYLRHPLCSGTHWDKAFSRKYFRRRNKFSGIGPGCHQTDRAPDCSASLIHQQSTAGLRLETILWIVGRSPTPTDHFQTPISLAFAT
jgi:hypothetical protein